ncbi:hypothetical protein CHS0354_013942 [Potamilus streckersoni]|uniref:Uncharacterized protein n=1 Tax=Potamilus streckersoni TaxID=2493646 RepID=A0AAE0VKB0_9BIVA|nr:hypothetical protein CHS0354_013942 [Potamilus streckersoni]
MLLQLKGNSSLTIKGNNWPYNENESLALQLKGNSDLTITVETVRKEISAVTEFLLEFGDHGFNSADTDARETAERLEAEMSWPEMHQR